MFYAARRSIPPANLSVSTLAVRISWRPRRLNRSRRTGNQSTAHSGAIAGPGLWSRPYAVACMSITTAFAAGTGPGIADPDAVSRRRIRCSTPTAGCRRTRSGWWPAMLIPTDDAATRTRPDRRGIAADGPLSQDDLSRSDARCGPQCPCSNLRRSQIHARKSPTRRRIGNSVLREVPDAIAYFTGAAHVDELARIHFLPGAVADHLTSTGGVLSAAIQMSALEWLEQGATASYGTVSEPCNTWKISRT